MRTAAIERLTDSFCCIPWKQKVIPVLWAVLVLTYFKLHHKLRSIDR